MQSLLLHLTVDNVLLSAEPQLTAGQYMQLASGTSKAKHTEAKATQLFAAHQKQMQTVLD